MWDRFEKHKDIGLLILRIGVGFFYIVAHGWPKISGGSERWEGLGGAMGIIGIDFFPVFWGFWASSAEFFGGMLLILGLAFRPAAAAIAFTMFIAMVMHISNGDPIGATSHSGKMLFVFIGLFFVGAGKYSLDNKFFSR